MSAAHHTPTPWLRDRASGLNCDVRAASGKKVALCFGLREPKKLKGETPEAYRVRFERYREECDANACRIVAAVNACEGVPTEVLEASAAGGLPWHVADQIDQRVIRGKLVAALQPFVERFSSDETITITVRTADVALARALIAEAGSPA